VNNTNLIFKNTINMNNQKERSVKRLSKQFDKIFLEIKSDINNKKKTLNFLSKDFRFNFKVEDLRQFKKFKSVALIGMGGSILGAEAIYSFLQTKVKKKFYFFNNLDENKLSNFKKKNLSKILFVIISKSGNTIETLSNAFALNIIKKNAKNIILITEKKNNILFSLSKKLNLFYVEHKNYIGGRYSVLSEVGIIPAYLMGINVSKLRSKITDCLDVKNKSFLKKSAINLVNLINSKKCNNLIFLNYFPEFEKFLYWYQQLIAESLGKKNKGFLPVISSAPKDHHSLLQLYLDGPKDKLFNIFSLENQSKEKVIINKNIGLNSFINGKKLSTIKNSQKQALIKSFIKKNIPFSEFKIKLANEQVLGKLFSFFIIETVIICKLLKINPYDQPAVEQVKIYTKQLLS
jgi:glucose-6-phosphate isomerase